MMSLLIAFIILTFVLMIGLDFMYNKRDVYVICDVIMNNKAENIHVISGIFTDKKKALRHYDNLSMYMLEIPLNKFKKLTKEDLKP